jgi:hypothetical protein
MVSSVSLLFGAVAAWAVYTYVFGLASGIAKARRANLPYIVVRKFKARYGPMTTQRSLLTGQNPSCASLQSIVADHIPVLGAPYQTTPQVVVGAVAHVSSLKPTLGPAWKTTLTALPA